MLLGLTAASIGQLLRDHQVALTRISGAIMLAMALFLLGSFFLRAPWLYQEKRFHPQLGRYGVAAPVVAGVAFGFGWSPCFGPILGSILGIAASQRPRVGRRVAARRLLDRSRPSVPRRRTRARPRSAGALGWVKRHSPAIVVGSAVVLGVFGILLMFDELSRVSGDLQRWLTDAHLEWIVNLG